jgi:hypothetical protein
MRGAHFVYLTSGGEIQLFIMSRTFIAIWFTLPGNFWAKKMDLSGDPFEHEETAIFHLL